MLIVPRGYRVKVMQLFSLSLLLSEIIFMYNGTSPRNVSTLSSNRR